MPPKKREKESEGQKVPRMDQIQADHELFLQAFEKPTQIYRFLRTRNQISPIFLYRNLSYMRQRMSRSHKSRRAFRIDTILDGLTLKNNQGQNPGVRGYMTLTFLGFYDKKVETTQEPVKVETLLLKICHKKRKDVSLPIMQNGSAHVSVGTSEVPINPSEDQPPPKAPTISIPNESFSLSNGHIVKTYMLLLRVYCMSNNSCLISNCDLDEPAQKRRKSINGSIKNGGEEIKLYGSELIVYDKHNRCLLTDGDYELGLQEVQTNVRASPKKHSSWECITEIKECGPFEVFSRGPTLKFRLSWTTEPSNGLVDRPPPIHPLPNGDNKENRPGNGALDRFPANHSNNNNSTLPNSSPLTPTKLSLSIEKMDMSSTQQIVYQFLYNNNSRQQTEACEDLHCPWCSLDCGKLYSLLKHLKLCHSRFTFTYVPISQGARIDVAINECYDGSYSGSPHELISQPSGVAFARTGPTRRTSVTNILVCRPKRTKPSLSEFLELDENDFESQRPYITGHNRLYHHTVTCLPIYPKEMDVDSEGENDPKWLQTKTMMMIDDFTDVNEGEKELMKMWNLHVMKYGYVGDCQIPLACQMFLETKGKELLMKNLYRNFVLHMCSLFDFGLVSPVILYQTIQKLQEIMKEGGENSDVKKILQKSHEAQVERWVTTGVYVSSLEATKPSGSSAKTNFNNEVSNLNARRKTTLPLGSPPNPQTSKITVTVHNNASKHASTDIY
ncbi:polycomb protein suz12-B isoform X1 [Neodiprion pinetum]|uniref:Polycomb protein suz12-B isoform X1 n=1 Tax=Neodiprion lecontei TaxID=441921 RepID=A0ABM3GK84_NEOLC|nr:polycomb protein suz12-B isoform X1 [Neodiprion fabricii]XP_046490320.1 polycomb protein suz12-B isoform X1 [Neodiprion pinetum]XP_046600674.1 polycomb protein suz12-B isoform X1 [Neodiprion lecontei]XP_046626952.1 polycomb protein suz12-B isoform X1 [Neodiprion virginianus]